MEFLKESLEKIISVFFKIYFLVNPAEKNSENLDKALDLYKGKGFVELFSEIRTWDAPFESIESKVPIQGVIVDLGSGDGLLGNYLAIASPKRHVFGIELNKERVKNSYKGFKNTKFLYGNILKADIPKADCILLVHVLHHLNSFDEQEKLIEKCKTKLRKGGKLLIVEISEQPFSKYMFTKFTDMVIVPILFENRIFNPNINFRKISDWRKLLKNFGFNVKVSYPHKGKPFSHVLFEAYPVS